MTRKETPIDWDKVDELLVYGCTGVEIAAHFGIHPETLYDRVARKYNVVFSAYSAQKKAIGDELLKQAQFNKAIGNTKKGDNTLLIWLGKQRLGQKENTQEQIIADEIKKPFDLIMTQIKDLQEARKIEANSLSTAPNSACETEEINPAGGNAYVDSTM